MHSFRVIVPLAGIVASATTGSSAPASGAASSGSAPTKAQLQKINLQASDLPATYQATPADSDSGDNSLDAELATCTGLQGAPESHQLASAESDDFALGNVTISSDFSSYQSAGDITADVAQLKSPKINECLNTAFKSVLAKSAGAGTTVTSATIKLTQGSGGGPSNVVALASGVVDLTVSGQKAAVYLGVAFITGPQLDGSLTFVGVNKPLDSATQTSVLTAVADRAQHP